MKNKWCDHAWSPWRGCTKVSPGCANCYAETLSKRNPAVLGEWGKGKPRVLAKNWNYPVKWNQTKVCESKGCAHFEFRRPKVFPSLCDWLDEEVPIEWLARFLGLIQDTPNIDWQLLTKRPELWRERMEQVTAYNAAEPWTEKDCDIRGMASDWIEHGLAPSNVWIGVSVEDQQRADERIPELLNIPARVRFLSVEPLLGQVNLHYSCFNGADSFGTMPGIDWVIVGGESGSDARPCNVAWIRDIVRQCRDAGVPCFVKQLGANVVDRNDRGFEGDSGPSGWPMDTLTSDTSMPGQYQGKPVRIRLRHPKGGDPTEWPEDLRVRQMPEVNP